MVFSPCSTYAYAWKEKGQRFHALKSGRRQGPVNMIAALCAQQLMALFTIEAACNRVVFETQASFLPAAITQTGTSGSA